MSIRTLLLAHRYLHEQRRTRRSLSPHIRRLFSVFAAPNQVGNLSTSLALAAPYRTELAPIRTFQNGKSAAALGCPLFRRVATISPHEPASDSKRSLYFPRTAIASAPLAFPARQCHARPARTGYERRSGDSMAPYNGVDFIDFDSLLNDEEKLARQSARQFVEAEVIPIIEKHSREGTFPKHLVPQLGELGFFGASLHGYGCAGMSNVAYGLVTQELERGDSGLRSFVSVQSALVMYPIYAYGNDAQKDKWLPLLAQGKAIGCFGLTEPQFGSNPGGMLTRAVKKGNKYVLNGEKMWITSGSIADIAVVWAKCEDEKVRGFLAEKGTPGFKAWDVHDKWSLRASVTSGLSFSDCEILLGNFTIAEGKAGSYRGAQRPLVVNVPGFEAGRSFFNEEPADFVIVAFRPD